MDRLGRRGNCIAGKVKSVVFKQVEIDRSDLVSIDTGCEDQSQIQREKVTAYQDSRTCGNIPMPMYDDLPQILHRAA